MDSWLGREQKVQISQLRKLLHKARHTEMGGRYGFSDMLSKPDDRLAAEYASRMPVIEYEDMREDVMRMLSGERDILWPGLCRSYAQSSGTSGGKSKYIPITGRSLKANHIAGASDAVASYIRTNPKSRMFRGKGFTLGGSFANELGERVGHGIHVGDLSATLIASTPPIFSLFRCPPSDIALMADWEKKLPALVDYASNANITNISGVPSWMLVFLQEVMASKGVGTLHDIWPGLEVFFHGGISFDPYRSQYEALTDPKRMRFVETYNASEGFFAVQTDPSDRAMQLLLDRDIYFEFLPIDETSKDALPLSKVEANKVYALIISGSNGLWRYSIGDTVLVKSLSPFKIKIAGRTKTYINAFGEELMEHNAEHAVAAACVATGARVSNYTAGPFYASEGKKGRHQWLIEWEREPSSIPEFSAMLDRELQAVNSDYQAKRAGDIFLDSPEVITVPEGHFHRWLASNGNGKLGGQRKIPRLCPTREIFETFLP